MVVLISLVIVFITWISVVHIMKIHLETLNLVMAMLAITFSLFVIILDANLLLREEHTFDGVHGGLTIRLEHAHGPSQHFAHAEGNKVKNPRKT